MNTYLDQYKVRNQLLLRFSIPTTITKLDILHDFHQKSFWLLARASEWSMPLQAGKYDPAVP